MPRSTKWQRAVTLAVAIPAMLTGTGAWAGDKAVCYKIGDQNYHYGTARLVLDVKRHSDLTTIGPKQTVYDALGKDSFVENYKEYMAVAHGAVVVSKKVYGSYRESGAHLGLISEWVRGPEYGNLKPINWDCTSPYEEPTPAYWSCTALVDGYTRYITLARTWDPYCGAFQNGSSHPSYPRP